MPHEIQVQVGPTDAPATYTLAPGQAFITRAGTATFRGVGASGDFWPCLSFYAANGSLIGRCKAEQVVSVGDSAEVTFGPFLRGSAAAAGGGIQFDVDNVGDWLEVEATGAVGAAFSQPNGAGGNETSFGAALNIQEGLLITADPAWGNFPLNVYFIDPAGGAMKAMEIIAESDNGSGGGASTVGLKSSGVVDSDMPAYGIIAEADGNKTGAVTQLTAGVQATGSAKGNGTTVGVDAYAVSNGGSGTYVAVRAHTEHFGGGAPTFHPYEGYDHNGTLIFMVDDSGNIHIPAGANVIKDL